MDSVVFVSNQARRCTATQKYNDPIREIPLKQFHRPKKTQKEKNTKYDLNGIIFCSKPRLSIDILSIDFVFCLWNLTKGCTTTQKFNDRMRQISLKQVYWREKHRGWKTQIIHDVPKRIILWIKSWLAINNWSIDLGFFVMNLARNCTTA